MADRVCIRGCTKRGVHYAACEHSGPSYVGAFPCAGCAPRECRDGSLICDQCFGRMRALISDAPDLLARLRSIGDPTKATAYDDVRVGSSSSSEIPAPIAADLIDAMAVVRIATWWDVERLRGAVNNLKIVTWLGALLLDRHPEVEGLRETWSVQDAVDRWGVERRDAPVVPGSPSRALRPSPEYDEATAEPRAEWDDPLIGWTAAAKLAGTTRTLQRWLKAEEIVPAGEIWIAGVRTRMFRRSEVLALRDLKRDRKASNLVKDRTEGDLQ